MTQAELYTYARRLVNASATDWAESDLVVDLNNALSDIWVQMNIARGTLEFDDTNHTDLPAATFPVTAGTHTYKITTDGSSNGVVTFHKVALLKNGVYVDIPRLKVSETNQDGLLITSSDSGFPSGYYEMGANVVFNSYPDESTTGKVWFDRNPSFFAVSGSKTPGIPTAYHSLIAEKAALIYAISKGKDNVANIQFLVDKNENKINEFESSRRDDERVLITPNFESTL